jgi:tetratricopeptide (TPR) repeat protein/serine/threonine protein kinase
MTETSDPAKSLFLNALEITSAEERQAYLVAQCGNDTALRRQVEVLLGHHAALSGFLQPRTVQAAEPATMASAAERPGTVIGPYKLLEQIGEGGMGTVWMAEQTEPIRRRVAIKVVKEGMDSKQVLARFDAERQALALMEHPHIAKVFDAGRTPGGRPYFVMELVKGQPITKYCDDHRLGVRERLELFGDVCRAVQHAHQKGIIHRDLKPSNVLVAPFDGKPVVKVIDFGVAKATGQRLTDATLFTGFGAIVGTPEYMSPEQAEVNNQDIDTRSDVYSLGVLLYELLTGTTPLTRKRIKEVALLEVLRVIREEEPPRPSTRLSESKESLSSISAQRQMEPAKLTRLVRGELDWIAMKALDKNRNRRYETANGFALDVQRYLADEPVQAFPPTAWYRLRKFARRNQGRLAVAACVILAVMVMSASIGWALRDRAVRREQVEGHVRDSLHAARTLMAANKVNLARQRLMEARAQLDGARSAHEGLAAELQAGEADLDRFQNFLDLIDRAHEVETAPSLQAGLAADASDGGTATLLPRLLPARAGERQPAAAVPFLLQALDLYQILERDDWSTRLHGGLLAREQVEHIRRAAYEELLWLADDLMHRKEAHRSGQPLSSEAAARQALVQLSNAENAHLPTQALYALRARCRKALGEENAFQADRQLAEKTAPTIALDHYLRAQAAYDAKQFAEGVQACEAALRLEPTHYWSMMRLGYCLCDLGRGPEDFSGAARVFTGCILKRPQHAHAYYCRANASLHFHRYEEAVADYTRAIEVDPQYAAAWNNRGATYGELGQPEKSVADCTKAIALDPKDANAWTNRGVAYLDLRQAHQAVADYSKAIELNPKFVPAWINRAAAYAQLGHADKAIADCARAIELDPKDARPWYSRGNAYSRLGDSERAVANYGRAIELDPKLTQAWNNRGTVYCDNLGRPDKAIIDFSKAIELDPKNARRWYNRGNAYRKLGQLAEAVADFTRGIELNPKLVHAWSNRGVAYGELGQQDKAIADCTRAIELDPRDRTAWYNRGNTNSMLGRRDEAIADFSKAIDLDQEYVEAWCNRGIAYSEAGQPDKAVGDYTRAIELNPKLVIAWSRRGAAYARLGQRDKAIADCAKAIELNPKNATAWFNQGNTNRMLGRRDQAIADYSQAIELDQKYMEAWFNRGDAHREAGQSAKAIADFSRAIELKPKVAKAWNNRGIVYCDQIGQPDKAIADFSKAIELDPRDPSHWTNRGNAQSNLGQPDKAVSDYTKAIEVDPRFTAAWYGRGHAHIKLDQLEKAVADFSRAIELDPKNAHAWNSRGTALLNLGQAAKAVSDFSKAVALTPKLAEAWSGMGNAHLELGEAAMAIADFTKAIDLDPTFAGDWYHRGRANRDLGRFPEALADYQRAVKMLPTEARLHNALGRLLATCPHTDLRDPKQAVDRAKKAVELAPKEADFWNTLGIAHYGVGAWKPAVTALVKSTELRKGGDACDWLFLAMAHKKLGNDGEASKAYNQAVQWLEKNKATLAKDTAQTEELRRFRSEAEEVLELKKK